VLAGAACDDPGRRRPDIALAALQLDWSPRVALRDGLARTIEWFDRLPAGERRCEQPAL
jgi:nucleoside-diphosphate-sugar epimerase